MTVTDTESFIKKSRQMYGNKYSYDKTAYMNYKTKLTLTCPVHGDFQVSPKNHLSSIHKLGCAKCSKRKLSNEVFTNRLQSVHEGRIILRGDSTGRSTDKQPLHCTICGHDWEATGNSVLMGSGCPNCFKIRQTKIDKSKALELRKSGLTFKAIAKELGCSEIWCYVNLKGIKKGIV